jgi:hypothetical protein
MKNIGLAVAASILACVCGPSPAASAAVPATTRQVVLAKNAEGRYAWSLVRN